MIVLLTLAPLSIAETGAWIGADPPTSAQVRHLHKVTGAIDWSTHPDLVGTLEDQVNVCSPRLDAALLPNAEWLALDVDGDLVVWQVDAEHAQLIRTGKSHASVRRPLNALLVAWPSRGFPDVDQVAREVGGPVVGSEMQLPREALEQLMTNPYECLISAPAVAQALSSVEGPVYVAVDAPHERPFVWRWDGGDEPFRRVSR